MSVTANLSSSATPCRSPAAFTSSNRSPSVPKAASATPIVITGPSTVRAMATASFARIVTCAPYASALRTDMVARMLVFVILGHTPLILLVCLIGLLYLTWVELRDEDLQPQVKVWWGLLVFLTNVAGYVALRIWLAVRRRRAAAHRPA